MAAELGAVGARSGSAWFAAVTGFLGALTAGSLAAQSPAEPTFSIGQPSRWEQRAAVVMPYASGQDRVTGRASYGVYRSLMNPLTGLLGVTAEGYAATSKGQAGVRALGEVKAIGLMGGLDWDIGGGSLAPIVSFQSAVRRGGLIGHGTMMRLDWEPTRDRVAVGMSIPVFRPLAGRTRPQVTTVQLSAARRATGATLPARVALEGASIDAGPLLDAARSIAAFSNAYSSRAEALVARPGGYRAALDAYASALAATLMPPGRTPIASARNNSAAVVARARRVLFDRVILPIDSVFGQAKDLPDDLAPLGPDAASEFAGWLADSSGLDAAARDAAGRGFVATLGVVGTIYRELLAEAGDSRLVWLPMELGLTADQYDEQSEVDSLMARAVGHPFTDQNALTYLRSTDLPLEIARSIYAAREYHVLWTHDFTGRRETGEIDNIGYSMVADAYLPALTAAVKRYDSTGVIPTYIILQDEFFYEPRDNRLWMDILEHPLHATIRLRGDSGVRESHLRERQDELRRAVASSARLRRDAAATGDAERWLASTVKVHVNIVEPWDFSFRSSHIIPGIPFTPDNLMRDHRKLVFYDLNEAAPYRGALLIMGVGVGEHYASATWEDRGYRMRGPATLEARRAVRSTLLRNGFSEAQIPAPLRAVASVGATERAMNAGDYVGRALQVHNESGFARKESSVARAMLYNLAPPGSVILAPDPMWMSDSWAGMLAGAAARGCKVYIIAPAAANAPSPQAPLIAVERQLLSRLLALDSSLAGPIRAAGGELRIGIFAATTEENDASGRAREIRAGLARSPWIRSLIPFDDRTIAVLQNAERQAATAPNSTSLAHDPKPRAQQLHQKSQLIARPGAIAALVRQPGWDAVLARSIEAQAGQTAAFAEQLGFTTPDVDTTAARANDALLRGYERTLSESERRRVSFYFSLGTQNQDPRGIVSDAEATLIVSGVQASAGLVDLYFLMARSEWLDRGAELDRFLPPSRGWLSRLAWRLRSAF